MSGIFDILAAETSPRNIELYSCDFASSFRLWGVSGMIANSCTFRPYLEQVAGDVIKLEIFSTPHPLDIEWCPPPPQGKLQPRVWL